MYDTIKLFGERNTNTNYMRRLIELNLDVTQLRGFAPPWIGKTQRYIPGREWLVDLYFRCSTQRNLGWKHACLPKPDRLVQISQQHQNVAFLTITKNPYSWLLSLHRNPYHCEEMKELSFIQFLKAPWKTLSREGLNQQTVSAIELWNIKNRSYLSLDEGNSLQLRTEDLFEKPDVLVDEVATKFGVTRLSDSFIDYVKSTKRTTKDKAYYQDYYLNERWSTELSAEAYEVINATVDQDLMQHFGYKLRH